MPEPEFSGMGGGFKVAFKKVPVGEKGSETRTKTRVKTREKILAIIKESSSVSMNELAEQIGISQKGIEWQVKQLKKEGILKRVGSARGGNWKVISE